MPNHFHMIVNSGSNPKEISSFMHRFMTSYSVYINKKYKLVGRLLESPYKAKFIPNEQVFRKVIRYIDNNPIKAGLVREKHDYRWLMQVSLVKYREKKDLRNSKDYRLCKEGS
jgi:putative transposase